jgi:hypothetical protein
MVDGAGRFIGFRFETDANGQTASLVILERDTHSPETINYDAELGLNLFSGEQMPTINALCASNGDAILFTSTKYLMKYSEDGLTIWHDNLDDYLDSMSIFGLTAPDGVVRAAIDNFFMWGLFCDKTCEHFIILQPGSVMFGGDEIDMILKAEDVV